MGFRAAFYFALFAGAASAQVTVTWIGQACFVVRSADASVVTDPPAASIGYRLPALTADAVTVTHNHPDHNNTGAVSGAVLVDGRPVTARLEMAVKGLPFVLIPGFHDNANGSQRGPNTMIRWTQGGLKLAHLGDLGQEQLTAAQRADLMDLDILFIPAGGGPTISPERAAQYLQELRPKLAILMHYRTGLAGPATVAGLPAAAAPFAPVQYKPATVTIRQDALPAATETWVMLPAADTAAVNAATFQDGAPVAPGSIVSLFGSFPNSATAAAPSYPLPPKLGETELMVDGRAAPLFFVSPGQVNAQIPFAIAPGQVLAEVRVGGQSVGRAPVTIVPSAPGFFAAVNQGGALNSPSAPARRGQLLVLYGTGLGAVDPPIDDGAAAGSPTRQGVATPNVFLMGRQFPVQFSGLTADFAGLWQINLTLPDDAPTGPDLPLTVVLGQTSNTLKVTVVQ
jgi:uncharacterized protein (TIGR03437 family)